MKTNRKMNVHLYNLFKDVFTDEDEINEAVRDAKRAFTFVQRDALFKKHQP